MAHSEICPVCGGVGKVFGGKVFGIGYVYSGYYGVCYSCGGVGWVVVPGDNERQPYFLYGVLDRLEMILKEFEGAIEKLEKIVICSGIECEHCKKELVGGEMKND